MSSIDRFCRRIPADDALEVFHEILYKLIVILAWVRGMDSLCLEFGILPRVEMVRVHEQEGAIGVCGSRKCEHAGSRNSSPPRMIPIDVEFALRCYTN